MEVSEITALAEKLYTLRKEIDHRDEEHDLIMSPLKQERDQAQADLIAALNATGLASLKVSSGDTFTKAQRRTVAVIDPYRALEWAKEAGAVKIDTALVAQMVKDGKELPEAFRPEVTEYISVRKSSTK
jgi:hypothetical protein